MKTPNIESLGERSDIAFELTQDPLTSVAEVINLHTICGMGSNMDHFLERWVLQRLQWL